MSSDLSQPELRARWAKILFGLFVLFVTYWLLVPAPVSPARMAQIQSGSIRLDLFLHIAVYGTVAFFTFAMQTSKQFGAGFLFVVLHAVTTESLQAWIPNRTCDIYDFFANMLGMFAGFLLLCFCRKLRLFTTTGFPVLPRFPTRELRRP